MDGIIEIDEVALLKEYDSYLKFMRGFGEIDMKYTMINERNVITTLPVVFRSHDVVGVEARLMATDKRISVISYICATELEALKNLKDQVRQSLWMQTFLVEADEENNKFK